MTQMLQMTTYYKLQFYLGKEIFTDHLKMIQVSVPSFFHSFILSFMILVTALLFSGCMKDDEWIYRNQNQEQLPEGVFIVNEGNFMYGNSTLSFYNPITHNVTNDLFYNLNGLPLGDVGQSMKIYNDKGYIVMNNSGKIYVIDILTGKYIGKITGLTSPRYVHFINSTKAYVTDLYAGQITIFNPETNQITGAIITHRHASTEQMVQIGDSVYVTCWSFDNTILVIDTKTDSIKGEIKTGVQPGGIVADKENKLWVMCDGGWGKPGTAAKTAVLQKFNPVTGSLEKAFNLSSDVNAKRLIINNAKDTILYMNKGIWKMAVNSAELPDSPFISNYKLLYGLGLDPVSSEVYFSDAIDYSQKGIVYRYSGQGARIDSFKTGIIPGYFCFK